MQVEVVGCKPREFGLGIKIAFFFSKNNMSKTSKFS